MAKSSIGQVTTTQTFQNWLDKTNQIVTLLETDVMTASALGDTTTGNATLVGSFTANTVIAFDTLRADTISPKSGSTSINITSPVSISSTSQNAQTLINSSGPRTQYSSGTVTWRAGFLTAGTTQTDNFFTIDTGIGAPKLTLSPTGNLSIAGSVTTPEGVIGNVTGNVSGNVTGNVSGNVTGNVSGNITGDVIIKEGGTLDASGANTILGLDFISIGAIMLWSGTIASIPSGWALCNGQTIEGFGTTPNLSGKFVVGYNEIDPDYNAIGKTGGADSVTLTTEQMPAHGHTFSGTTNTTGSHNHNISHNVDSATAGSFISGNDGPNNVGVTSSPTAFAGNHAHTFSGTTASVGSGQAHENRPSYYTVAYIIKVSGGGATTGSTTSTAGSSLSSLAGFTTSDLTEGTNLYFTNARALAAVRTLRAGDIGTYIFAVLQPEDVFGRRGVTLGQVVAGSDLIPAAPGGSGGVISVSTDQSIRWGTSTPISINGSDIEGGVIVSNYGPWSLVGTWQACGASSVNDLPFAPVTLWLRIA